MTSMDLMIAVTVSPAFCKTWGPVSWWGRRRGFPPNDKLLKLTVAAYNAIHSLTVEQHYMGCESGVGRETIR